MVRAPETPRGRLLHLEITDFKSYRGLHVIGPFTNFTAVIGPNGSGKSNLMDAISFVCGVKTAQLRGSLQELLFTNSQNKAAENHPTSGRVALVFEFPDKSQQRFARAIVPSSAGSSTYVSKYHIDERTVTLDEFTKGLLKRGVNTKARNFLVFQGDIEKVASKSAAQLTAFFEIISGSEACKEEYDALEADAAAAEEATAAVMLKKRQLQGRKRAVKVAKDEAERYLKERQALDAEKAKLYLWKLYHVKYDLTEAETAKAEHEAKLEAVRGKRAGDEALVGQADRSMASLRKKKLGLTKQLTKLNETRAKENPQLLKLRELANRQARARAAKDLQLKESQRRRGEAAGALKKTTASLKAAQAKLKKAQAALESGGSFDLTPELQQEYQRLKVEADQETYNASLDLRKAAAALQDEQVKHQAALNQVHQMQSQRDKLLTEIEEGKASLAGLEGQEKEQKARQHALDLEVRDLQGQNRKANTERTRLQQKLEDCETELRRARSDHQQGKKQKRMAEVVRTLRGLYPDHVHGRLLDTCTIKARKHNVAVTVLLGRHMDSIIVSSSAKAKECVEYLRNNQHEPLTFIPLDSIRVKQIDERLRQLGGTAKLGIDLVEYPEAMEKALMFAFENSLVCEGLGEAKRLGFREHHKVVTLDGTLIARNGAMTGGTSKSMAGRAGAWDAQTVTKLQEERAAILSRLQALPDEGETAQTEGRKKADSLAVQQAVNALSVNADALRSKIGAKRSELANVEAALGTAAPAAAALAASIAAKSPEVADLQAVINETKDAMFREFSAKLGVANVREFEATIEANLRVREDRLSQLNRQIAELGTEAEALERSLTELDGKIARDQEHIDGIDANVAELEAAKEKRRAAVAAMDGDIAEKGAELKALDEQLDDQNRLVSSQRSVEAKYDAEEGALKRTIQQHKNAIAALVDHAKGIQQDVMLASVALPTSGGARGGDNDSDSDGGSADDMDVDGDDAPPGDSDTTAWPRDLRALDFRRLSAKLRKSVDEGARERLGGEMQRSIADLASELEASVPNLKAPEEYAEVLSEEQALQQDAVEQRAAEADTRARFNAVRERRTTLFNGAFDHISSRIDEVYKALTRSVASATGGTAMLSKDDDSEPFRGGVKYCAIPPNKRYRAMEQLSGGEKTLAALALLMAVHSYSPSPFFVLDEIDAALDAGNLSRVAHYIRSRTRSAAEQPFQGIIISLKDVFYEKADALVGVSRDVNRNGSVVYTFDLDGFGEPQE